jgi:hypothetical protein
MHRSNSGHRSRFGISSGGRICPARRSTVCERSLVLCIHCRPNVLAVLSAFILIPRPLLCALAGYFLGFWAVPLALAGILLGSALAFISARHLLRAPVGRMLAERPWISAAMEAMHLEGFRLIALPR